MSPEPQPPASTRTILVCHDGSAYGSVCSQYAATLPFPGEPRFRGIYVSDLRQFEVPVMADLSGSLGIQPYQGMVGQLQEFERRKADLIEQTMRDIFAEHGKDQRLEFAHRTGLLVDTIEEMESEVDLVMMGKRGENANFATGHLGATMERVLRGSRQPCLVTSRACHPVQKALIAYDDSANAQKAADTLVALGCLGAQELHIVAVAEHDRERDNATRMLAGAETRYSGQAGRLVCQLLHGASEEAISQYIDEQKISLLAMGAFGHSRIREFFLGSTTTEMMRRCKVPILCCR